MKNTTLEDLLLLDEKANKKKNPKRYKPYLPFHISVYVGDIKEIKKYIAAGYDINTEDKWGNTAIFWATVSGKIGVLKLLVKAGGNYNFKCTDNYFDNCSLLHLAASYGYYDEVRYLVEELHLDINEVTKKERTPLWYSMQFYHPNVAGYLVNEGAKFFPNENHISMLFWYFMDTIYHYEKKLQELEDKIDNGFLKLSKMLETKK